LYFSSTARTQRHIPSTPFLVWNLGDVPWAFFYRHGDDYLVRFPDLADFLISSDGLAVEAAPVPGISKQTVEHLYLNQVLPLALSRQFKLVLHGGAIEIEQFAVVFLGFSGQGKSTLAASFATSGHRFLTDDGLQLVKDEAGYVIQPSHPSIRLWDDSRQAVMPEQAKAAPAVDYTPKARLLADNAVAYCDIPRPLRCVYFLGEGKADQVLIEPVSGRDAMVELVTHSFLLDVDEREMMSHHFGQLAELAAIPMFFRLDYPRQYDMLPAVRETLIQHATSL
jgi:hypothetical protein